MRRERLLKRIIILGLLALALQFTFAGFIPNTAVAGDGGTPPQPVPDTTGTPNGMIVDTTGLGGGTYSTAPSTLSTLDIITMVLKIAI